MSTFIRLIALTLCAAFTGCMLAEVGPPVTGSGVAKSEDRAINGVTRITLSNIGTITIKQSDKESLTIKADDNIVPLIESDVSGGTLTLGLNKGGTFKPKTPIEYIVEVKSLEGLSLTGAAIAKVSELDGKTLSLTFTGACQGTLEGKMDALTINGTGACKVDAAKLSCKKATVTVTGASTASVNAEESLNATATGACTVTYMGDPKVTKSVTGASSIKKR